MLSPAQIAAWLSALTKAGLRNRKDEDKAVGSDSRNCRSAIDTLTPAGLKGWGKVGCQCRFLRPADDAFRPP